MRVLVAEDNKVNQRVLALFLEKMGIEATLVDNGGDALEEYMKMPFEVILMDIQMPEVDGIVATKNIRTHEAENGLKKSLIIGISAHYMVDEQKIYIDAGFDRMIPKPINFDELSKCMNLSKG